MAKSKVSQTERDKRWYRRKASKKRHRIKKAIEEGKLTTELPEPLMPEVFQDIQETYWKALKSVKDPRDPRKVVYPLYQILHRAIAGLLSGEVFIGCAFPKQHYRPKNTGRFRKYPTRNVAYRVLREIDWTEAQTAFAPLWEKLGMDPDFILQHQLRDPREIISAFLEEKKQQELEKKRAVEEKRKKEARSQGMSAACAKRGKKK